MARKRKSEYDYTLKEAIKRIQNICPVGWFQASEPKIRLVDLLQLVDMGVLDASHTGGNKKYFRLIETG